MADKIFVGRSKPGKYPDQVDIGFTQEDLDRLQEHMNDKGWVNCRLNKGKESGKPYMEIVPPYESSGASPKSSKAPERQSYTPPPNVPPLAEGADIDDLPF